MIFRTSIKFFNMLQRDRMCLPSQAVILSHTFGMFSHSS